MLNATITPQSTTTATDPSSQVPAARTANAVPLKIAPAAASARRRLWPPIALANGNWKSTRTSVFTKKIAPIPASLTPEWSFTYGGSIVAICAYAAATSTAVRASSQTKLRLRRTCR
jgi:hypothetical protein